MKQNQQRERACGVKARGNQEQASKSLLPVELHKTHLIPPAMSYDTCQGKLIRDSVP